MSTDLLGHLKAFNAKERFWLLDAVLGSPQLAGEFRCDLRGTIGLEVPPEAWWAMDYHLDWIEASLQLSRRADGVTGPFLGEMNQNQEDVDLIVAWNAADTSATHVVLIEAKGVTAFNNRQSSSKFKRLARIFEEESEGDTEVVPHFVITSPSKPSRVTTELAPDWAVDDGRQLRWMKLDIPELTCLQRCDALGAPRADGGHWRLRTR